MPNTIQLNFRKDSLRAKIYNEYFINSITDIQSLSGKYNISEDHVRSIISRIRKKIRINSATIETETPILNTPTPENSLTEKSIQIKIYEEGNDIILLVQTSADFEQWLKANKEIRSTTNLWNRNISGKFYHLRVVNNYTDDINYPIIINGLINFAVLRIPGISAGLKFKLDGLLTQEQLEKSVRKLIEAYNLFYKNTIIKNKINITAEVVVEK